MTILLIGVPLVVAPYVAAEIVMVYLAFRLAAHIIDKSGLSGNRS